MKKKWIILFIAALAIINAFGNSMIICGKISNCSKKQVKLEVYRSDAIWLLAKPIIIKSKTTDDGSFYLKIENINHFLFENKLQIGSKIIYLAFAPGDSINISFDYLNNSEDIVFNGINASKNYFMNTFQKKYLGASKTPLIDLDWLNQNQKLLLECYDKYKIDTISKDYINQYLYCNYWNQLFTSHLSNQNDVKIMFDTLNIQNEKLSRYSLYYSLLSGYLNNKERISLDLTKTDGLKQAFDYSEKYLFGTIKENYQAYLIGYTLVCIDNKAGISKNEKDLMIDFVSNCSNDYLKTNMIELLRKKRIL